MAVIIKTSIGDITVALYVDQRPKTCLNFLKLCKVKYYNYVLIHSVQRNLCVQTGDPTGTGRGGDSIYGHLYGEQARFFEMESVPKLTHEKIGTISMINNGADMHGSQFLITTAPDTDYLDGKHTVFGEVVKGVDVLMKMNEVYCDSDNRPYRDIRILHTVILDDPTPDPRQLQIPARSPSPRARETIDIVRIGIDETIDDLEGMSKQELEQVIREKEAKANAQILEMVGDIPDAEMAPPKNVLFVCKLNPVTSSEDLEIIFSRFGNIISCEVIRDNLSGQSLQYAFIEFEKEEDCERAYFKMDNVLIDDRRIHVDFSQSLAKSKWEEFMRLKKRKDKALSGSQSRRKSPSPPPPSKWDNNDDPDDRKRSPPRRRDRDEPRRQDRFDDRDRRGSKYDEPSTRRRDDNRGEMNQHSSSDYRRHERPRSRSRERDRYNRRH